MIGHILITRGGDEALSTLVETNGCLVNQLIFEDNDEANFSQIQSPYIQVIYSCAHF